MSIFRQTRAGSLVLLAVIMIPVSLAAQRKKKHGTPPPAAAGTAQLSPYKSPGGPLPEIRAVYPGKAVYTTRDVQNDANLFVMMFNPTCEHCEAMTLDLSKNIGLFKRSNILLLAAPGMGEYLDYFRNNTHIEAVPAIRVGLDSSDFIQKTFLYESLPQVNVYSPEGKLLRSFSGITTIDSLRQYIQ